MNKSRNRAGQAFLEALAQGDPRAKAAANVSRRLWLRIYAQHRRWLRRRKPR